MRKQVIIKSYDQLVDAIDKGEEVYIKDAKWTKHAWVKVLDYKLGDKAWKDRDEIRHDGLNVDEWYEWRERHENDPAIVLDRLSGTNFKLLDEVDIKDFDKIFYFTEEFQEAEKLTQEDKMKLWHDGKRGFNFKTATPEKLRTNFKICKKLGFKAECKLLSDELKKRGLKIAGKDLDSVKESRRKNFYEHDMTREEEIARDNYEREQEESGQKFLVYPKAPAPNRYLTGTFGLRDSYVITRSTLYDLVRTCVNYDTDIEVYECDEDDQYSGARIYDILAYVYDDGALNESLKNNKKLKESKLSAEQLAKKIDEIAEACGDYYFDTYCGGVAATDPDEIRDELDKYIIDTTHSGEFVSPHDFPHGKGYSDFCFAAKEAAWECIYFNYDVAKEQAAMNESRRSKRKSLHERGMTEYGVSHADEIYRDNYERELAKSGDKYIVRPRTQATNRYLTGDFGVRDSYELSFSTLRDLVRKCVNSNDDIELYETGDDYYFKDDGRIYDVLGFVNDSLNESLVKEFFKQMR